MSNCDTCPDSFSEAATRQSSSVPTLSYGKENYHLLMKEDGLENTSPQGHGSVVVVVYSDNLMFARAVQTLAQLRYHL